MIETIVPIELKNLKKYFEDKTEIYLIDYEKSKLKGAQFLTYLSNLDVPCDLSNYDDELLKEYFESSMLVNIPLLEKAAMIVLFEHKGLVKEIKNSYDVNDFFNARIPNYKVYASIYKLFESVYTQDPKEETESRFTIIENITKKSTSTKKKDKKVLENYKKQEKDLRLLTYTVLVEKFNKKYKKLTESQRDLLRKYIYNISNTNSLKEFIEKESIQIKKQLQSFLPKIDDKVTKIKLTEAINQIGNLLKGRIVEDNQVVALMRYYQLVRELKDVSK